MADRAQINRPKTALSLGRRNDPAEARVAHRLDRAPLRNLHDGTLDRLDAGFGTGFETGHDVVPDSVHAALEGGGQPLDSGLRSSMESAFGEHFGDVRLHTGPDAAAAARDIDSAAFASGNHIGFARGAFRPDTAAGRGIIAHELAHTSETRSGRDAPGMVRRVGAGQWFARLFGGGTFTDTELAEFLNGLKNEAPGSTENLVEFTNDSDNMARAIVARGFHKAQPLYVRFRLIEHLLDGAALEDDETAVMQILRDATQIERETMVAKVTKDRLKNKIDNDALRAELDKMIEGSLDEAGNPVGGTETSKRGSMPVTWRLDHTIKADPTLTGGVLGLQITRLGDRPDGEDYRPIAFDSFAEGLSGRDQTLSAGAAHPKDTAGEADLGFWVVPKDSRQEAAYETKTLTALPLQRYSPVQPVDGQIVTAKLDVQMAGKKLGEDSLATRAMVGAESSAALKVGHKKTEIAGSSSNVTKEKSKEKNAEVSAGAEVHADASRNKSKTRSTSADWKLEVTRTIEVMQQFMKSDEFSTTDETETSVEFGGTVQGQIEPSIEAMIKGAGSGGLKLAGLGTGLISKILGYLPIPQSKTVAAIVSLLGDADVDLAVTLEAGATAGLKMMVGGSLSGKAAKLWRHSTTTKSGSSSSIGVTGGAAVTGVVGGSAQASDTDAAGASAGGSLQKGAKAGASEGERLAVESGSKHERAVEDSAELTLSEVLRRENEITTERKRDVFVPDVTATLSFRVEKDIWGGRLVAKPAAEDETSKRKKKPKAEAD
jgi:Domain of unknown function (DUF4157)